MGKNKKVMCEICPKMIRGDNIERNSRFHKK